MRTRSGGRCGRLRPGQPPPHQPRHRRVDHRLARLREVLVVLRQPAVPTRPRERPLGIVGDPATLRFGSTWNPSGFSSSPYRHSCRSRSRTASIRPPPLRRPRLHRPPVPVVGPDHREVGQPPLQFGREETTGALPVVDVGAVDARAEEEPRRVDEDVPLPPGQPPRPVVAALGAAPLRRSYRLAVDGGTAGARPAALAGADAGKDLRPGYRWTDMASVIPEPDPSLRSG